MPLSSVLSQLDTATLSSYRFTLTQEGQTITHTSWLVMEQLVCQIDINHEQKVVSARYRQIF
ncbi:MAG: hypothetical protein ABWW63_05780 [Glaciecola sp.]